MKLKALFKKIIRFRKPDYDISDDYNFFETIRFFNITSIIRGFVITLLKGKPRLCSIGKSTNFVSYKNINLFHFVKISNNTKISSMGNNTSILIEKGVSIGAFCRLEVSSSIRRTGRFIKLRKNVGMGDYCQIGGYGGVEISENTIMGSYVSFHPLNHDFKHNPEIPIRQKGVVGKGIFIGKSCWLGAKSTILDGVILGDNCVVAAGAVVTKSFPNNSIIGGVPAKILKK